MATASRLFLLEIRSLTFLAIKIVDLMFRKSFIANILVAFLWIRSILLPSLSFEHFAYVNTLTRSDTLVVNNTIR